MLNSPGKAEREGDTYLDDSKGQQRDPTQSHNMSPELDWGKEFSFWLCINPNIELQARRTGK
jgi:hypothetical protein